MDSSNSLSLILVMINSKGLCYGTSSWGSIPGGFFIHSLCSASYEANTGPVQWVSGGSFPVGNVQPWHAADHSPPSCAKIERGAIPPLLPKHLLVYSGIVMMMINSWDQTQDLKFYDNTITIRPSGMFAVETPLM
jgi:hypothetical protein